jgi:hypothetical protein
MNRPLLSLSIFSAVFFGIILFSVIFGGYSSLYRAQNRARDARIRVTVECQKQLDLLPDLIAMVRKADAFNRIAPGDSDQTQQDQTHQGEALLDQARLNQAHLDQLDQAALNTNTLLTRMNSQKNPLEKQLVLDFEHAQVDLSQAIIGLVDGLKEDKKFKESQALAVLEKKFDDLEITVFYHSIQYNKEARYFNTRKSIFPGFLIAKIFNLEQLYLFEINADLFKPANLRS